MGPQLHLKAVHRNSKPELSGKGIPQLGSIGFKRSVTTGLSQGAWDRQQILVARSEGAHGCRGRIRSDEGGGAWPCRLCNEEEPELCPVV